MLDSDPIMVDPPNAIRQVWRIVALMTSILVGLFFLWAALPVGIDFEPEVRDYTELSGGALDDLMTFLGEEKSIYRAEDGKNLYRETFWKPWNRSAINSSVRIERDGVAYLIRADKEFSHGVISKRYFATREDGKWDISSRGAVISKE